MKKSCKNSSNLPCVAMWWDMAVGIIIGGAFGKIVSSVVADIIMPPVGFAHRRSEFLRPENHIERRQS